MPLSAFEKTMPSRLVTAATVGELEAKFVTEPLEVPEKTRIASFVIPIVPSTPDPFVQTFVPVEGALLAVKARKRSFPILVIERLPPFSEFRNPPVPLVEFVLSAK